MTYIIHVDQKCMLITSYFSLSNLTDIHICYITSGYIPFGFITWWHFFASAFWFSAYKGLLHFNMKTNGGDKSIVNSYCSFTFITKCNRCDKHIPLPVLMYCEELHYIYVFCHICSCRMPDLSRNVAADCNITCVV